MSESNAEPTSASSEPSGPSSDAVEASSAALRESVKASVHARVTNDFGYHKATEVTGPMHDATRAKFAELAHWVIDNLPYDRHLSLAITSLQEAQMWCNAAIATQLAPMEG